MAVKYRHSVAVRKKFHKSDSTNSIKYKKEGTCMSKEQKLKQNKKYQALK